MKIVQQTIASLGSPMWIEPLERPDGSAAVIARWRHLNGRLRISTADAVRVCLSLSTGQQVRHAERDRALSKSVLAGDVIVLRPGIPTETTLEGDAELIQIFIEPESLGQVASNTMTGTLVPPAGDALKRAVIQLFVAARHGNVHRRDGPPQRQGDRPDRKSVRRGIRPNHQVGWRSAHHHLGLL
jgi:hypothetical protein